MIKTCNGCKALNWSSSRPNCALHEEIQPVKYVGGVAVQWQPTHGMCAKPKTRAAFSVCLRSMCAKPLKLPND